MKKGGFTLVELIVTISILLVLGTIAFIALWEYTISARDSKRIQDISTIDKSLELTKIVQSLYPVPSDFESVVYSGATVWKQGTFGDSIIKDHSRIMTKPFDALFENDYTYSITKSHQEYEIGGILEKSKSADHTWFQALVRWNYNGKILVSWSNILAIPSIIAADL